MGKRNQYSDFLDAITRLSLKLRMAFDQQVSMHGLTYPRARVLFRLANKESMTQAELALSLNLQQATVVRLLDRMEEHGFIERRPDATDRRVKRLYLTPYGVEQARLVHAIADAMRRQIVAGIEPDKIEIALHLIEQISDNISSMEHMNVRG
ncbi:MarR family transcriptional regulator [Falsochrobactrum shanghaiense]|uniref:MarR family transcriptional regulator n=1 Tax=Falsochrobactrum shanghaiense TaxID=2201899 RepID=A0A316JC32_9HYPH|nr:MarR family transcriptional regulator [Falsochrobactrum shanghaiense]PWL18299.1 MarR family transcriptional regulator [Falsochrobactrum shanghaiense]